jgi:hypothetical protein
MSRVRDLASILTASSSMATDTEVTSAISAQSMAGKNFVINGGFDIFQRAATPTSGTTVSGGSGYSIDRWIVWNTAGNGSIVTSRQLSGLTGIQYCARIQRPSGNTAGLNFFAQPIETSNSILLAGKTFTFSFYARKGADYSNTTSSLNVEVWQNTTTDGSIQTIETGSRSSAGSGVFVLTTSWQRFTFTSTFLSTTTQVAPVFYGVTSGTAGANDYYEITGVQLEINTAASTFSRAGGDIQGELAKCQRYFETGSAYFCIRNPSIADNHPFGSLTGTNFQVAKRATPTVTLGTVTATSCYTNSGNTVNIGIYSFEQRLLCQAGGAQTNMIILAPWTASAEL